MINAFPSFGTQIQQRIGLTAARNVFWACRDNGNFGDWIGPFLFEKLSGLDPIYCTAKKRSVRTVYMTAGSIFHHIRADNIATIWGSGVMQRNAQFYKPKLITAVRGPLTRKRCLELGIRCPEIYGDPGILLPFFIPQTKEPTHAIGLVPHLVDFKIATDLFSHLPEVRVINVLDDMTTVVKQISQCSVIISSSLHGIIVAHAYGRPALRAIFSEGIKGDGTKYLDYAQSISPNYALDVMAIEDPDDATTALKKVQSLSTAPNLKILQRGLVKACPFATPDSIPDELI